MTHLNKRAFSKPESLSGFVDNPLIIKLNGSASDFQFA
jgi:hypothetical protein